MTTLDTLTWIERAEIILVFAGLALLVLAPRLERNAIATAIIGLLAAAAAIACSVQDGGAGRLPLVVTGAAIAGAMLLLRKAELFDERQRPESAALVLIGGIGAIVLSTGTSMLELALGVEMLSLSGAALIAFGRGQRPLEAGFKYFLLTAVTFATFLFGMALVFVGTGSLAIPTLTSSAPHMQLVVACGAGLMVIGLAFKLAVIPVHFGALDAYTAGPASFVGFVMMASKLGAGFALAKLAVGMGTSIQTLLMGLGVATIAFGVVASFAQTDFRRLLAYSAVAHAGFIALAAASAKDTSGMTAVPMGKEVVGFYIVCYGAAALLCFAAMAGTGTDGYLTAHLGSASKGLGRGRSLALLVGLLSLAGVPPTPGFFAKLAVLQASYHAFGIIPTTVAALGGVLGVIYYLKPMPDLLASTTNTDTKQGGFSAFLWLLIVLGLGASPMLAWRLAS